MTTTSADGLDTTTLGRPIRRGAVRAFVRQMALTYPTPQHRRRQNLVAGIAVGVILLIALALAPSFIDLLLDGAPPVIHTAILLALLVFFVICVSILLYNVLTARRAKRARFRISQFAADNAMEYVDRVNAPRLPGMIFQLGLERVATSVVRSREPRYVEFGNYEYLTGNTGDRIGHLWGYVALRLDAPLPNIVLDALGNNTLGTNLPASFSKDQRLSLEGDFDQYFTLYCPRGYEADALYLFTPDIMARFIDHAAQLDVEIVDDWMFLYLRRPASTTDPATWMWLLSTVDALTAQLAQWARWRDGRISTDHEVNR